MTTSASKVWAVVRREYLVRVTNKWFLIITLGLPLLMAGLMFLAAWLGGGGGGGGEPLEIGVVVRTEAGEAGVRADRVAELIREEGEGLIPDVPELEPDAERASLIDALRTTGRDAFVLLERTPDGSTSVTLLGRNTGSQTQRRSIRSAVQQALLEAGLQRAGVPEADVGPLFRVAHIGLEVVRVEETGQAQSQAVLTAVAMGLNLVLYMMFIIYGQVIARGVLEEKSSDIVEILLSSLRPWQMMLGKIVGIGAVGLTQIAIWAGIGTFLFLYGAAGAAGALAEAGLDLSQVTFPFATVGSAFLVYFVLGYLLFASGFAAVAAMVGDEQAIQNVNFPLVMLIVIPFFLAFPAAEAPSATWVLPASLFPFFSPILMVLRITMGVAAAWEIVVSLVLLVLSVVGMAWVAGRIFRVGILMKGKRPTLPELLRWVRYG